MTSRRLFFFWSLVLLNSFALLLLLPFLFGKVKRMQKNENWILQNEEEGEEVRRECLLSILLLFSRDIQKEIDGERERKREWEGDQGHKTRFMFVSFLEGETHRHPIWINCLPRLTLGTYCTLNYKEQRDWMIPMPPAGLVSSPFSFCSYHHCSDNGINSNRYHPLRI